MSSVFTDGIVQFQQIIDRVKNNNIRLEFRCVYNLDFICKFAADIVNAVFI